VSFVSPFQEIQLLTRLHHENIVPYLGTRGESTVGAQGQGARAPLPHKLQGSPLTPPTNSMHIFFEDVEEEKEEEEEGIGKEEKEEEEIEPPRVGF
jgi:hypothetical protein